MAAGSEALVLKVSADTSEVASGLAPMTKALDTLAHEADAAADELRQLDAVDVKLSVRDEALAKARSDIERLRNEIAHGITMGLDTKGAQRELSQLESAVRKLADKPERVEMEVEVDKEALATAVEGVDSLREGALGLGEAVGALDGTLVSFGQVMRETVPALADLNQTMAAMKLRNEAAGRSFGVLGRSVSAVTGVMAGPWGWRSRPAWAARRLGVQAGGCRRRYGKFHRRDQLPDRRARPRQPRSGREDAAGRAHARHRRAARHLHARYGVGACR